MSPTEVTSFVPRRGRPTARQVQEIERSILATARRLLLQDDHDSVTMETIAAEAKVSKGTIYARYKSREELFEAVVSNTVREWSKFFAKEDQLLNNNILDRLRHHARTIARSQINPETRALYRLSAIHGRRVPALHKALYQHGYLFTVHMLVRDIEAAAVRDGIPVRNADGVARHLVSAITGWYQIESADRDVELSELETVAVDIVEILFAGRAAW